MRRAFLFFSFLVFFSYSFEVVASSNEYCQIHLLNQEQAKKAFQNSPKLAEIQERYKPVFDLNALIIQKIIQHPEYKFVRHYWLEKYLENEITHTDMGEAGAYSSTVEKSMTVEKLSQFILNQIDHNQMQIAGFKKLIRFTIEVFQEIELEMPFANEIAEAELKTSEYLSWLANSHIYICYYRARSIKYKKVLSFEDLFFEGYEGLLRATQKFRPDYGVQFSTYANYWVKVGIARAVFKEKTIIVDHKVELKLQKVKKAIAELLGELHRTPSLEEIVAKTGVKLEEVLELESLIYIRSEVRSMDEMIKNKKTNNQKTLHDFLSDKKDFEDLQIENIDKNKSIEKLKQALKMLTPRERFVIESRYLMHDLREVPAYTKTGEKMGVSDERVRQIEQEALQKIKKFLGVQ